MARLHGMRGIGSAWRRIAALAGALALAGCGMFPGYANSGAQIRDKEWTSYAWEDRTPPQHCYRTLALAECFQSKISDQEYRVIPSGVTARAAETRDSNTAPANAAQGVQGNAHDGAAGNANADARASAPATEARTSAASD